MGWSGHAGGSDATAQALAQRARQGDQAALAQLHQLALTWAPDHRNAAIDAWNSLGIGAPMPEIKNPHHGVLGAIGSVLKTAAPFAALIPGVGPLAAAGIAAGGSALGGAMEGQPFNLGKTLEAGAAGFGGAELLGGQGVNGISGIPARLGMGGGGSSAVGNMTQSMGGAATDGATAAIPGAAGAGGGFSLKGALGTVGHYLPLGIAGLNAVGAYQNAHKANQLRDEAIQSANQQYADRAPFRLKATEFAEQPAPGYPDLTSAFADPGNPYYRAPKRAASGGY